MCSSLLLGLICCSSFSHSTGTNWNLHEAFDNPCRALRRRWCSSQDVQPCIGKRIPEDCICLLISGSIRSQHSTSLNQLSDDLKQPQTQRREKDAHAVMHAGLSCLDSVSRLTERPGLLYLHLMILHRPCLTRDRFKHKQMSIVSIPLHLKIVMNPDEAFGYQIVSRLKGSWLDLLL